MSDDGLKAKLKDELRRIEAAAEQWDPVNETDKKLLEEYVKALSSMRENAEHVVWMEQSYRKRQILLEEMKKTLMDLEKSHSKFSDKLAGKA